MEDKLKSIIQKDIERRVKDQFQGKYVKHMLEVNEILFKLYGKKEKILLDALVNYFTKLDESKEPQYVEYFIEYFIDDLIERKINPNLILNYFLNGTFNLDDLTNNTLFQLIKLTKNKDFLLKVIKEKDNEFNFKALLKLILGKNPLGLDNDIIEIEVSLFKEITNNFDMTKISEILNFILLSKRFKNLPKQLLDEVKNYINSLNFVDQAEINRLTYGELPNQFFDKLRNIDYKIIGSPQGEKKLMIIRNPNEKLYGYVNGEGKVIIPPLFDEVGNLQPDGKIKVFSDVDRGDVKAGIYYINQEGKIIQIIQQF
jgi:hypothetical protein